MALSVESGTQRRRSCCDAVMSLAGARGVTEAAPATLLPCKTACRPMSSGAFDSTTAGTGSESEPEVPDLAVVYDAESGRYRSLSRAVLRAGAEAQSEKTGFLQPGEIFAALETRDMPNGVRRARMDRGWVSFTAKSGKSLLVDESSVQTFLQRVPLLQQLSDVDRQSVADVLEVEEFTSGSIIMEQGEQGDSMYFLESGAAQAEVAQADVSLTRGSDESDVRLVYSVGSYCSPCRRTFVSADRVNRLLQADDDTVMVVKTYGAGDYFGELALMMNQPRAATVRAAGDDGARCLKLQRAPFDVIAKGCHEILEERRRLYKELREQKRHEAGAKRGLERARVTAEREAAQAKKAGEREEERQARILQRDAARLARQEAGSRSTPSPAPRRSDGGASSVAASSTAAERRDAQLQREQRKTKSEGDQEEKRHPPAAAAGQRGAQRREALAVAGAKARKQQEAANASQQRREEKNAVVR